MVEAAQVKDAVNGGLDQVLGVLRADDDVAQLARPGNRLRPVDREREDVCGLVPAAVVAVQCANAGLVDERDRDVPVEADSRQRSLRRPAKLRVGCLNLAQRFCW